MSGTGGHPCTIRTSASATTAASSWKVSRIRASTPESIRIAACSPAAPGSSAVEGPMSPTTKVRGPAASLARMMAARLTASTSRRRPICASQVAVGAEGVRECRRGCRLSRRDDGDRARPRAARGSTGRGHPGGGPGRGRRAASPCRRRGRGGRVSSAARKRAGAATGRRGVAAIGFSAFLGFGDGRSHVCLVRLRNRALTRTRNRFSSSERAARPSR